MVASNYCKERSQANARNIIKTIKEKTENQVKIITTDGWKAYPKPIQQIYGFSDRGHHEGKVIHNRVNASKGDGFNYPIERVHNNLRSRTKTNGFPPIDILNKPFLDLRSVGILMNKGEFKGASLDNLTGKQGKGSQVPEWYAQKDYEKIIAYVKNETEEFLKFAKWLYKEMPELREKFKKEILSK